jgi:2-oxoglutarate dehydrogenase dihydrolipoamide succinyltransferase (E2 component)
VSSSRTDHATDGSPEVAGETVQVQMPQMGVSVAEGTIVEWRKRPGDWIEADETIADVTTDKIDVEIPAPASGRVRELLVEPGETVPVGTPLAEIDTAAKPGEAHPEESERREREPATNAQPSAEPVTNGAGTAEAEADRSGFHSPVVRRIAAKHGVDLGQVKGTGIGGRIRKRDLLAHIEGGTARPEPVLHTESPYRPDEPAVEEPAKPEPATEEPERAKPVAPAAPAEDLAPGRREPMSPMRQVIARHMLDSRRTSAHCTTIVEADFSRVAARRSELRDQMRRRGVNLTYLAFVARATVEALEEHPILNASVEGDEIVYHDDVNLGIAVALDDGLIVPVIRQAQRLSVEGLAAEIADVATRARERRLEPDEVHGGTFTITNPGQFGAVLATPIINQPQVAILDLEAIVKRPVVVDGPEGESIAIRPMSFLCMSWDHRALDGATAARFLASIKDRLERWEVSR